MDENVGIETCKIKVDNTILYPDPKVREELKMNENEATEMELTSETAIYDQVRDKHFDYFGPYANQKLQEIQNIITKQQNQRETTEEIKNFQETVLEVITSASPELREKIVHALQQRRALGSTLGLHQ